jgi:hypothetical protein
MKQNHCTPDLPEFPGGLQKIFIRTLCIKHKIRDGAEHNTLMGRGGGSHSLVPELNEDLLSPYIPSKLGVTQDDKAHA